MPSIPRRPSFYLMSFLLLLLLGVVYYLTRAIDSPELQAAAAKARTVSQGKPPETVFPPSSTTSPAPAPVDSVHQQMADQLNSPDSTPQRDTEIIREFLTLYGKAYHNGNPVGLNEDITAALTGSANPQGMAQLFPRGSPAIRNGQLVDRWGTPYWFHPESATKMEIRSAGPDKQLFTGDDIILDH